MRCDAQRIEHKNQKKKQMKNEILLPSNKKKPMEEEWMCRNFSLGRRSFLNEKWKTINISAAVVVVWWWWWPKKKMEYRPHTYTHTYTVKKIDKKEISMQSDNLTDRSSSKKGKKGSSFYDDVLSQLSWFMRKGQHFFHSFFNHLIRFNVQLWKALVVWWWKGSY